MLVGVGFVVGDVVGACANTDAPKPTTTTHKYRKGAPIDGAPAPRARSLWERDKTGRARAGRDDAACLHSMMGRYGTSRKAHERSPFATNF